LDLGPDEARRVAMNIVQGNLKEDKLVAARKIQTALKSFFEFHDRVIKLKRIDKIRYVREKIAYEVIPNRDQVYRMVDVFKELRLRSRAVILCLTWFIRSSAFFAISTEATTVRSFLKCLNL